MEAFANKSSCLLAGSQNLKSEQGSRCTSEKVLCEISHQNVANQLSDSKCVPLKQRGDQIRSGPISIKKPPLKGKENAKEIDDLALKMISYTNISRTLEEKNHIIDHQKTEIAMLKQCVNDIHYNRQAREGEEEARRQQEIKRLKRLEKEYTENLSELESMKEHFRQIKKKYDAVLRDKSAINKKYSILLSENQQLTVLIDNLKSDLQSSTRNEEAYRLEQQVAKLNEETKEKQIEKNALEQRCSNFERKVNEYVLKFNDLQANHTQHQIKYYKLQKDHDDLNMQRDQLRQTNTNLLAQLQAERQIHQQQVDRMKLKLKKSQEALQEQVRKHKDLNARQKQAFEEEEKMITDYRWCILQKDQRISDLQGDLKELERQMGQKQSQENRIGLKISQLQSQIEEGNSYLNNQILILNEQNKQLSELATLNQLKIQDLSHKNQQLEASLQDEKQKAALNYALGESNIALLEAEIGRLEDELSRTRRQEAQEKRYYRQKYERSLQQYNQLSFQFRQLQTENNKLLATNATNAMEMGNLQAEVVNLTAQIQKLLAEEDSLAKVVKPQENNTQLSATTSRLIDEYWREVLQLRTALSLARQQILKQANQAAKYKNQLRGLVAENEQLRNRCESTSGQLKHLSEVLSAREDQLQTFTLLLHEKENIISAVRSELARQAQDVKELTQAITHSQHKYRTLIEQHQDEIAEWEKHKANWQFSCLLEKKELQSSKLSVSRGLDSSQATVEILRKENLQLQRILGTEIERRNQTIRQLINQKKKLFEQLIQKDLR